ncbi:helix-turn-helix transcriptional regulator [Bacillus badius]|uniref:helix-turn-helix domain-containing protein n=1 Tax=Bacillus badius TaxID=1455 RepID=UPI002E2109F3|nr:helix-turn-helix transcriptional regulator [Bacillus badius]
MSIGENVKKIRKEKKLTQHELAEQMNISRSYLSDIENNRKNPSSKTLESLAEKLNVTMFYLTTGKKAVADLTIEERTEAAKGIREMFKKQNEEMQIDLKKDIEQLLNSELNFIQTIYLSGAINFLKSSNDEDVTTLTALLMTLNQNRGIAEDDDISQTELLNFIEETTKEFKDFLKARLQYTEEGE